VKPKPPRKKKANGASPAAPPENLVAKMAELSDEDARQEFLDKNQGLVRADIVAWLTEVVRRQARVDTKETLRIAEFTVSLARKLGEKEALAQALRAKANALYVGGKNQAAVDNHRLALDLFRELGNQTELARTLSSAIQPQLLLGDYDGALASAEEARRIFTAEGNEWRLARVELNTGNIYHRQDRFEEALASYERAYKFLLPHRDKDAEAVAVVLHNMAVCLITLNDFRRAASTYEEARRFALDHEMPLLVSQADYNIAWLYYLRGEYGEAIERLRATRETCRHSDDKYHFALCHLDLSEIYLELNLSAEAGETAQTGATLFEALGMGYEHAKCLTNWAISLSQENRSFQALEIFQDARKIFLREKNSVWPSLIDLYQALVLFNEGRYFESRRLCQAALAFFQSSPLRGKEILCHLLLGRLSQRMSDLPAAREACATAAALLPQVHSPHLTYQTHMLSAQVQEQLGQDDLAFAALQQARAALEALRNSLHGEELKMAFMKNKLEVYEGLVDISLRREEPGAAFEYVEQAKSRSLLDLMFKFGTSPHAPSEGQSDLVKQINGLREELNWYYHRIEIEQLRPEQFSPERMSQLQEEANRREKEFLHVLREMPSAEAESTGMVMPATATAEEVRHGLPSGTMLIEYFRIRDQILVVLVDAERLQVIPLTLTARVESLLRLLQFQLGKFRLGAEYVSTFANVLLRSTLQHLEELYVELVEPIRDQLRCEHLIVVPHDLLHYLPFHALHRGGRFLVDDFTITHAPSASVFLACLAKQPKHQNGSLVLGIPDPKVPLIEDEARSVTGHLPAAQLFLGEAATAKVLREKGPASRVIHIATHGYFRQDNPMFSGIKLGDSHLSLYDLYQLRFSAELITLSGCATGLNVVAAGDELLGLMRGLLASGAHSLLLSLWDVHDETTSRFMTSFYGALESGTSKSESLRKAMLEQRAANPHPYYWAPFFLVGHP